MFNNRNQLLPLLRSREYRLLPGNKDNDNGMVFSKRERPQMWRNVTRRFKRPIVVAPLDQNTLESEVKVVQVNQTGSLGNEGHHIEVPMKQDSVERHTFVNSDFVGIPSPVGYKTHQIILDKDSVGKRDYSNSTSEDRLSSKLPTKGRFILKNPLETTVRTSYRSGSKNLFKSPPVMEDKFFTTSLRDLFQAQSNKDENQKNNNKIVIITDDDLNDSKRHGNHQIMRQRSRVPKSRPPPSQPETRKPPMELPVYIQEQRQMTGMHPPPIQIPNIFLGEEETSDNEIKPPLKNDFSETKICEQRKPNQGTTPKPTKNPVHSSVMDIITNHPREPPNYNDGWSYPSPVPIKKPQSPPTQKHAISTPSSYMEMTHEFDSWSPGAQNNDEWSPNTPPFKPLHPSYPSDMDIITGVGNTPPYYGPNNEYDDDLEFPAETKKVVRLMMPEVKYPNQKISQQPFQLQSSQQFQKKVPVMSQYSGYPGTTSNIEQHRFPSPHMMLNDGLLFQRYNLLKEIQEMQTNLFGGNGDGPEAMMSNAMLNPNQMMSNPIMSSPLMPSPVQSMPSVVQSGPVMFSGNPSALQGPSMKSSGSFSQKGKPMKLMKFRVL